MLNKEAPRPRAAELVAWYKLGPSPEAVAEKIAELQEAYDQLNDFEQSQCALLLAKLGEAQKREREALAACGVLQAQVNALLAETKRHTCMVDADRDAPCQGDECSPAGRRICGMFRAGLCDGTIKPDDPQCRKLNPEGKEDWHGDQHF